MSLVVVDVYDRQAKVRAPKVNTSQSCVLCYHWGPLTSAICQMQNAEGGPKSEEEEESLWLVAED